MPLTDVPNRVSCRAFGVGPRVWMEDALFRLSVTRDYHESLRWLLPDKWQKDQSKTNFAELYPTSPNFEKLGKLGESRN